MMCQRAPGARCGAPWYLRCCTSKWGRLGAGWGVVLGRGAWAPRSLPSPGPQDPTLRPQHPGTGGRNKTEGSQRERGAGGGSKPVHIPCPSSPIYSRSPGDLVGGWEESNSPGLCPLLSGPSGHPSWEPAGADSATAQLQMLRGPLPRHPFAESPSIATPQDDPQAYLSCGNLCSQGGRPHKDSTPRKGTSRRTQKEG